MDESQRDSDVEAIADIETEIKTLSPKRLVTNICGLCEQSLQAALHSAGLDAPERDRVVNNYRHNVANALKTLKVPKDE